MKYILIFLLSLLSLNIFGKDPYEFSEQIPSKTSLSYKVPHKFNVFVWNLYMLNYVNSQKLKETKLDEMIKSSAFLLFQEIIADSDKTQKALDLKQFNLLQIPYLKEKAENYIPDSINNGLATISKYQALNHELVMGDAIDIADGTQSVAIISKFEIEDSQKELMVIHIHNGVSFFRTMDLLNKLNPIIQEHNGPLLVAGDFNSFLYKSSKVKSWAKKLKLTDSNIHTPFKVKFVKVGQLDHAFYRGLKLIEEAKVLKETEDLSDHKGYYLKFEITQP